LALFGLFESSASGSHIVGGEIFLQYLRGNSYQIGLILYYDQANADYNLIDEGISLGVFGKSDNKLKKSFEIPLSEVKDVAYSNSRCLPDSLKTLEISYIDQVNMFINEFSDPEGYYVSWERCCRNNIITNINKPGETGMVFYLEFPSLADHPFNSSPKFENVRADYVCKNNFNEFSFGCTDRDGDSLVYDFIIPLAGHTGISSPYSELIPAPYPLVGGFYQMPGSPPLSIDEKTGLVKVSPTMNGLFAFTVRCQEFRKGKKIGEVRRDFQIPVTNCPPNPSPNFDLYDENGIVSAGDTLIAKGRDSLCFRIKAWDSSPSDALNFSIRPINFEGFASEIFFPLGGDTQGPDDTLEVEFCWPRCFLDEGDKVFEFDIIVKDDACPIPNKQSQRFYLISLPEENSPPNIEVEREEYIGTVGEETLIRVYATDPDPNDILTLEFLKDQSGEFEVGYRFEFTAGPTWAEGELWIFPECQNLKNDEFVLDFSVFDNSCRENNSDTISTSFNIEDYFAGERDFLPPPNIITPNSDGLNDYFSLPKLSRGKCEKGAFQKVVIYNRWGQVVFDSGKKDFRWYAENKSSGDYYYLIEFEGFSYTGFITIII
jgi:gliding motility-associated-like protein